MSQTPEEIANRIMTKFSMKYLNHAPLELEIEAAIQQERAALEEAQKDTRRLDWYFGPVSLQRDSATRRFCEGHIEEWSADKWRTEIDAAMEKDCSKL
ncbi:MAG TPA: hypothetical protein VJQ59_16885 [Candidatus Sulfotelmatobacter sp.]|nr:hypothetical protein [Candidatus Sulfotelmatobacter sp.]